MAKAIVTQLSKKVKSLHTVIRGAAFGLSARAAFQSGRSFWQKRHSTSSLHQMKEVRIIFLDRYENAYGQHRAPQECLLGQAETETHR